MIQPHRTVPVIDGFQVIERTYSAEDSLPTVGLANIEAVVPGIEANKAKILAATRVFAELGVNVAIFPEFALSGYFWDDEPACRAYMDQALTEEHLDWIDGELRPLCGGELQAIVLNNLTGGPDGRYRNRTMVISELVEDPLDADSSYDKVYLPGIEKLYTSSGTDDRLVLRGTRIPATFGLTTCYDYLFVEELRQYAFEDGVDAIIQVASWRAGANREYPLMNVRSDRYYGQLWDMTMAASSAQLAGSRQRCLDHARRARPLPRRGPRPSRDRRHPDRRGSRSASSISGSRGARSRAACTSRRPAWMPARRSTQAPGKSGPTRGSAATTARRSRYLGQRRS